MSLDPGRSRPETLTLRARDSKSASISTAQACIVFGEFGGANLMLRQIIFGSAVSLGNIAIHALMMILILRVRRAVHASAPSRPALRLVGIMIVAVSMLMAAHLAEIGVWSIAYALVDAAAQGADDFYFAFVNYTTLGYGDIVPTVRWRLLG